MIIETNGTKRAQRSHKKKPTPEEPAGFPHGTLLEQERQRANQWEKNAASWKEQCDAKGRHIAELDKDLAAVRQQLQGAVGRSWSWKGVADRRGDRIRELEAGLAAARWSNDQYRKDNEFKAGILRGLWEKQGESKCYPVSGDYGPPNWTGRQRAEINKADPHKAAINHLLKAMLELVS